MKVKQTITGAGLITLALAGTGSIAEAAMVTLDGQPLATSVAPIQRSGRTLVPMRDIFQALGATVNWNALTQGITATKGSSTVSLQLGNRTAMVNGQRVFLDQAAMLYRGSTMVPMRFVSEAMGAKVGWDGRREIASITTKNYVALNTPGQATSGSGQAVAGVRTISVPQGSVVKVTLDTQLSSATARVGQPFTATVTSDNPGDSEFPAGSKIEGVVTEARSKSGQNPGVLDLDFRSVVLPGGNRYALQGSLTSLDNESIDTSTPGRITAKSTSNNSKDRLKVIGIGAGAGFLLGKLLKKNSTLTAVLGGAAGYLYDQSKNKKGGVREAVLPSGTQLGVRLDRSVTYADATNYYDQRSTYFKM